MFIFSVLYFFSGTFDENIFTIIIVCIDIGNGHGYGYGWPEWMARCLIRKVFLLMARMMRHTNWIIICTISYRMNRWTSVKAISYIVYRIYYYNMHAYHTNEVLMLSHPTDAFFFVIIISLFVFRYYLNIKLEL